MRTFSYSEDIIREISCCVFAILCALRYSGGDCGKSPPWFSAYLCEIRYSGGYSGKCPPEFSPFCERLGTAEVIPEIILLGLRQCVGGLGTAGVILGNVPLGFHLSVND